MRPTASSWLQLDADPLPLRTGVGPEWGQLLVVWSIFFITAGVYQLPATLLGARCNSSAAPCSIAQEFDVSDTQVAWLPATFLLCKGLLALPAGVALQPLRASLYEVWPGVVARVQYEARHALLLRRAPVPTVQR